MGIHKKNFAAIEQALNSLFHKHEEAVGRIVLLENNLASLRAELANQKQLTAHVLGRGMGSTVHKE